MGRRTLGWVGYLLVASIVASACALAAPPGISSFSPASGPVGEIVLISGSNLGEVRVVAFNGVNATIVGTGPSGVLAKVPTGATSGQISVTSDAGTAVSGRRFVVTPGGANPESAGDPSAPPAVATTTGYSLLSVRTGRGTFAVHLIKERLAEVSVRTVAANANECRNDCPVKPLAEYVAENGAYAGMNGTYLCPPDYADCAGKVNSYDYAVYDSNRRTWTNARALGGQNALVTFDGSTPSFFRRSGTFLSSRGTRFPITAGFTMYPLLLQDGEVVDSEAEQSPAQQQRSMKGSIGVDGSYIYLALVVNASVTDSAYVLRALGVRDALNLDGGGTAAMWIGGAYRVGPGRLLPNAVLLTKP